MKPPSALSKATATIRCAHCPLHTAQERSSFMQIRFVRASESFATGCSSSRPLIQWCSPIGFRGIHLPTDLQPWGVPLTTTSGWLAVNIKPLTYLSLLPRFRANTSKWLVITISLKRQSTTLIYTYVLSNATGDQCYLPRFIYEKPNLSYLHVP